MRDARIDPACLNTRGAYLHVPFCAHKCHYCDFYSIVDNRNRQEQFVHRMKGEIRAARSFLGAGLGSVFVGGGTPTLLETGLWRDLGDAIVRELPLRPDTEFTVEANPETVQAELLDVLVERGVSRLSIGAQSFDRRHLETLERRHDPVNVGRSVALARAAGIADVSLDLIFGIPGQTVDDWGNDLAAALDLDPTHLSCYGLTYEPGTPLTARLHAGRIRRVDEEVEAAMYDETVDRLARAGFEHYEISNWARPGHRCRHNLMYWTNEDWWPFGPSASGHAAGWRWKNSPRLGDYLNGRPLPSVIDVERLDADGRIGEELMLGLRLIDGIPSSRLEDLLRGGDRGSDRRAAIDRHLAGGLLERGDGRLRLTRRGLLLADTVLCDLV